jgi:acyl-CoA thioesterase YciA
MAEKELVIKVVAGRNDLNLQGDVFGGWIVGQMDVAAYLHARKLTDKRMVTVAIDKLTFHKPVFLGDCVMCYTSTIRTGRTSMTIRVEVMVERLASRETELVTEGNFVYVAIGDDRKPTPLTTEA